MPFRFESLEIWHRAREYSARIYEVTAKFPSHELYGLASQMNRSANAPSLLFAEGAGLDTDALFNHRLGLAVGETCEVVAGSFLALDRKYITAEHRQKSTNGGRHWPVRSMPSEILCADCR